MLVHLRQHLYDCVPSKDVLYIYISPKQWDIQPMIKFHCAGEDAFLQLMLNYKAA